MLVTLDTRDLDVGSRRADAAREEVRTAVPEADSAVAAAKANLDLAQVTFDRMQDLYQKKSLSNQEFDEARPDSKRRRPRGTWRGRGARNGLKARAGGSGGALD